MAILFAIAEILAFPFVFLFFLLHGINKGRNNWLIILGIIIGGLIGTWQASWFWGFGSGLSFVLATAPLPQREVKFFPVFRWKGFSDSVQKIWAW